MTRTAAVLLVCLLVLSGAIVWGHTIELFYLDGIRQVLDVFWGRLVLLDFAASLLLIGLWITLLLPSAQRLTHGIPWSLGVLILGTPIALAFFLLRTRTCSSAHEVFLGRASQKAAA